MAQSLYRTYRPQTFDEVIGQEHITLLLKNAIAKGKVTHSYLFVGPRGLGKTSVARIFAKALNCENVSKDGNPCNNCNNCNSITIGNFFDLIEIDAASNRGIDQIRELKERIAYQPTQGKIKVYIIDEVHMLTTEAFNALLKTLEEPPKHAVFILATTESYKLPATIVSRCQKYDFRLGSKEMLTECLNNVLASEKRKMSEDAIRLLVEQATGSYRDLLSLTDVVLSGFTDTEVEITDNVVRQTLGIPDNTMVYYFLDNLIKGDYRKTFDMLDEVYQKGVSIQQFIYTVVNILKQVLVEKTIKGLKKKSSIVEEFSFLSELSDVVLFKILKGFLDVEQSVKNSPIPTLPIEILIFEVRSILESSGVEIGSKSKEDVVVEVAKKDIKPTENKTAKLEKVDDELNKDKKVAEKVSVVKGKSSVVEKDDIDVDTSKGVDLDELSEKWPNVIESIKKYNGHLYAFLNQAQLIGCSEGTLKFKVPFAFHKDRITTVQSKIALQESFASVFGFKPKIWCKVGKCSNQMAITKPAIEVEKPVEEKEIIKSDSFVKEVEDIFKDL
ncbi:MAG TPA: DNA polymerase III subunit gamma/tau [Candidatus Dojkabacteria bacterium]|nr:DNA polymerase III subunit gamma/tau [Candidatus Dojkabacteria bacterium]